MQPENWIASFVRHALVVLACVVAGLASAQRVTARDADIAEAARAAKLDADALKKLHERAAKSESDALVIAKDGTTVGEWYFDKPVGPIEAMSATKSVVALAIGRLLADGRLESLDVPVHRYFPEWKEGQKAKITVRHLLTQKSGLQCDRITTEIYASPNFVELALRAEVVEAPGTTFRYNNKACNLIAGVVQKASGKRMDVLIGEEIFKPLGITDWSWSLDQAGNPHGMSGLQIRPADLAKVGQLMLAGGLWKDERILPEAFIRDAVRDQIHPPVESRTAAIHDLWGRSYGFLWWIEDTPQFAITERLLAEWKRLDAPADFISKMGTLKGYRGDDLPARACALAGGEEQWATVTWQANRPDFDIVGRTVHGYSAEGYLGQYLLVIPDQGLVAVRMRRAPTGEFDERKLDSFQDFKKLVRALSEKPGP